jgi:hypothetical protein
VIKQYIDQELQDQLFEHTRMVKERKMMEGILEKDVATALKMRDQRKDRTEVIRLANRPRVSRVQETKRDSVDIHGLVHSFGDLFPLSGHGVAA